MNDGITHAYVHRLADVHFAGFAPAFPLSLHDRKYARKLQDAHSLGRWRNPKECSVRLSKYITNKHKKKRK
jgi:hypothetical protein